MNNIDNKKTRDANFKLLRIIAMIMIIILHFNNGGNNILISVDKNSMQWYFFYFLEYSCIIAVNLYVMISGYYMIKSKIKIKKMLMLELQILFYSILVYIILSCFKYVDFRLNDFIKVCMPIITGQYWFLTAYMGLYFLIPFINKLVANISLKEYRNLIILLTILLSVVKTIYSGNSIFEANNGYGLTWFIYLYLLAGYIRIKYGDSKVKINKFNVGILIYLAITVIQIIIGKTNLQILQNYKNNSLSYNSFLVLIQSVMVFLFFKDVEIKNSIIKKIILCISPLTLGVYLIHNNCYLSNILWGKIIRTTEYLGESIYKILIILSISVVFIFTVCCIIEKIRILIFDLISKVVNYIKKKVIPYNKEEKNVTR